MKTTTNTSYANSPLKVGNLIGMVAAAAVLLMTYSATAGSSFTWSGAASDLNLDNTNNWNPLTAARPSSSQNDTLVFNGTVAGPLTLTNAPGNGSVFNSNPGFYINVTASQTGSLLFAESNSYTTAIRLNGTNTFNVASGAGAVTFGDGGQTDLPLTMAGKGSGETHPMTNNSANAVTFNNNVYFVTGGGGGHTMIFAGTGNWQFNTRYRSENSGSGSSMGVTIAGPGTFTLVGNSPNTALGGSGGAVTVNGGTLVFGGASAIESGSTMVINGGSLDSLVPNLVLSPGLTPQTWGSSFAFIGTQNLDVGAGAVTLSGSGNHVVKVNANTFTVDGIITNSTGNSDILTKSGAGTLYLTSSPQYWSGGTVISNGILELNASAFPSGTATAESLTNYGEWDLNGNSFTVSALNGSGTIDTRSGGTPTLTVGDFNASGSFSGTIQNSQGSMALVKTGIGSLILGGANSYSGGTTVNAGTLLVANTSGSGTGSGSVTVSSGATFGGTGIATGPVNWQSGSSGAFTITNISTGSAGTNGSPLTISGSVTLNGNAITINIAGAAPIPVGNYLLMTYNPAGSSGSFSSATPVFTGAGVSFGTTQKITTGSGSVFLVVAASTAGTSGAWINNGSGNWSTAADWSSNPKIPSFIGDSAIFGAGSAYTTVTLDIPVTNAAVAFTNANSFAIANAGNTLRLDNTNGGASIVVVSGTSNSIAAPISLNDNLGISLFPGSTLAISNAVSSTISSRTVVVSGAGTLALDGNNTYGPSAGTVGTTLTGSGTVQLGNNNAFGAGDVLALSSGTVSAGTAISVPNNIIISNTVTTSLNDNGNNMTLSGTISGNGTLAKGGVGTVTLSGVNTYTNGTFINAGTVKLGNPSGIPGGSGNGGVTMSTNTLLDLNGFSPLLNGLSSAVGTAAVVNNSAGTPVTLTVGESGTFATFNGNIENTGGALSLDKEGTGQETLGGTNNTYSGTTTINGGTLQVGNNNTNFTGSGIAVNLGAGVVIDNSTLQFNVAGTNYFTNSITGSGDINLANTNLTLYLSGNNTFSGGVTNNGGRLWITNASMLGTGIKQLVCVGAGNSVFTQIHLDGHLANITMPTNISLVLSYLSGVIVNESGSNTILSAITMPNGGGNPDFVVSNGFLTLAGSMTTVAGNNARAVTLDGPGNGLVSGQVFDDPSGVVASLTMQGTGTWTVSNTTNAASGPMTASAGKLVLSGSWLGPITINNGGTLAGTGTTYSNLTVNTGGIFVPGGYGSIGTFTVYSNMTLNGTMYVSLNKSVVQSNTLVNIVGINNTNLVANSGSSLIISNLGPVLVAGDRFALFSQAVTNGNLVSITAPANVVFTNNLAVDGSISVISATATNPTNITFQVSGNQLTLSWPADHLGWTLQEQTNSLAVGLTTNWVRVPNSASVTSTNIVMNPANATVFYRLIYP